MAYLSHFEQVLWSVSVALQLMVLALLIRRKNFASYPLFTAYITAVILQNAGFATIFSLWGYHSLASWKAVWVSEGLVLCARTLAVLELCHLALARFRGVWALARALLLACAAAVSVGAFAAGEHNWKLIVTSAEMGCNLAIAVIIVVLFLFARHYAIEVQPTIRFTAVGLCLYSCFSVLNDTVLQRYLYSYEAWWSILSILAFIGSLMIWGWAFRAAAPAPVKKQSLLSIDVYRELAPEMNARLRLLNDQLSQLWRMERP